MRKFFFIGITIFVLVAAGSAIVAVTSGEDALAKAESDVIALGDAPVADYMKDALVQRAIADGVRPETLLEIAAAGGPNARAGAIVGESQGGEDLYAVFSPHGFSSFTPVAEMISRHGPVVVNVSAQPGPDGATGHAQLIGVAEPRVGRVVVDLADGSKVELELVKPPAAPDYAFFTYTTDDPQMLPSVVHGLDASGVELARHNVAAAIALPKLG